MPGHFRPYLVRMIEVVGDFGPETGGRSGAFTHAVVAARKPEDAQRLVLARLRDMGLQVVSAGEEIVDLTGWTELAPSVEAARRRCQESGEVELCDFESYPLDDCPE